MKHGRILALAIMLIPLVLATSLHGAGQAKTAGDESLANKLLGAIIEKASGKTYEAFVDSHIFKPLGMKQSYYGSAERIIPRRIPGYQLGRGGSSTRPTSA